MKIVNAEQFAKLWHEGKVKWDKKTIVDLPIVFGCPHCSEKIMLISTKDEEETTQLAIIAGDFAIFVPKTATKEEFDDLMEKVILPSLEMFGKYKFAKKEEKKDENVEMPYMWLNRER